MNNIVNEHILRLIDEIDKDEERIRTYIQGSMADSDNSRKKSAEMAKMHESSLERKLRLLTILTSKEGCRLTLSDVDMKIFKS